MANKLEQGPVPAEKKPGHRAEEIVTEFLREAFPNIILNVEETSPRDLNDTKGIDLLCEVAGGHKLAVDVTFDPKRRDEKMKSMIRNPFATFRDAQGRPIAENVPRILLYERNMALWFDYKKKADDNNAELITVMDPTAQKIRFMETVIDQANGLSKGNTDYARKIKPVKEIFKKEVEKIKKDAEKMKAAA